MQNKIIKVWTSIINHHCKSNKIMSRGIKNLNLGLLYQSSLQEITESRGLRPPKSEHINTHGFRRDAQPA